MVDELYVKHREPLLRYCIVMCRDMALAEDLVQTAFLRAMAHLEDLEELNASQRRSWLYKTVRNLFYDHVRRVSAGREKEKPVEDETVERGYEEAEIQMTISCLPHELHVLFMQRYIEGFTSTELSEMYDVPAATIRGKLMKARQILKDQFREENI